MCVCKIIIFVFRDKCCWQNQIAYEIGDTISQDMMATDNCTRVTMKCDANQTGAPKVVIELVKDCVQDLIETHSNAMEDLFDEQNTNIDEMKAMLQSLP